jgi:protein-S-isoprenylcysteine O-methyltransferase Ste14
VALRYRLLQRIRRESAVAPCCRAGTKGGIMDRILSFAYGIASYFYFFAVFLYFIFFVGDLFVPASVSSEPSAESAGSLLWDALLLAFFGATHSLMARPGYKAWLKSFLPEHLERSTYVLASSVVLALVMWLWQPHNVVLWQIDVFAGQIVIYAVFFAGWAAILLATFQTDHFDLFGLRQVYFHFVGRPYAPVPFKTVGFYKYIRHPMMTGIVVAFWATPYMTVGHLLFAAVFTLYVLIGVELEEKGLQQHLGSDYESYRQRTPKYLPFGKI